MKLFRAEAGGDAQHVGGEIIEAERAFVVVGIAVAARVGRRYAEVTVEVLELRGPVAAVAADAVEKKDELAVARDRDREPRRRIDENRIQEVTPL